MAWRDEDPSRFGPINDGDYVPMPIDRYVHFIQIAWEPGFMTPAEHTACGVARPTDWLMNRFSYPIAGTVDCPRCLAAYAARSAG